MLSTFIDLKLQVQVIHSSRLVFDKDILKSRLNESKQTRPLILLSVQSYTNQFKEFEPSYRWGKEYILQHTKYMQRNYIQSSVSSAATH